MMRAIRRLLTLDALEHHPARVFASIGLVFALSYVAALTLVPRARGRIVDGDTIQYYAYLRSLAIDHDVDFANDYQLLYSVGDTGDAVNNVWLTSTTPTGRRPNMMSIGPAVLWAPFFLVTYAAIALFHPLGLTVPLDGVAAPFPLSAGVAGVFYAALGAWFCYRACRALMPEGPAFWGALVAWLASPAIYYSLVSPAYSHAPSLFASALFCDIWLRTRGDDRSRRYVWLGLAAGLAALVRWQDIVILGLPGIELLVAHLGRRRTLVSLLRPVALMGLAALVMMLPQMLAWHAIFGTVFLMPQGEGFMKWTSPQIIAVLFSLRHGLISWTPAIGLGLVGLWFLIRRDPVVGWSVLAVFLITVYVNASVSDWWAGEAFGARRFVGNTVFFALGLSAFFSADVWRNRPVLLRWIAALLILYNVLFLLQYELAMHGVFVLAPYPSTLQQVLLDRMTLPLRLGAWLTR